MLVCIIFGSLTCLSEISTVKKSLAGVFGGNAIGNNCTAPRTDTAECPQVSGHEKVCDRSYTVLEQGNVGEKNDHGYDWLGNLKTIREHCGLDEQCSHVEAGLVTEECTNNAPLLAPF